MPAKYAYYLFVNELPEVRDALRELENAYRTRGNLAAAQAIKVAFDQHVAQLHALSLEIAAEGTEALRKMEKKTRVRPDSQGAGGPRLGDSLDSDPIGLTQLPGSVGIANETRLDAEVPWWTTNEEGNKKLLGRRVYGFFEGPGFAPPNPLQFREHALFTPDIGGGRMTIQRPIPARRFILKAIPAIEGPWKARFEALKAQLVAEVAAAGRL